MAQHLLLYGLKGGVRCSPLRQIHAVKQRLHQVSFREGVISAYSGRCALSGLPEPLVLGAAHIVADRGEKLGEPIVPKPFRYPRSVTRLPTPIGIDPNYKLHVSGRL